MALKLSWRLFIGCYRSYFLLFNLLFFILSLHFLFFLKNFVGLAIFLAHHFMRLHFLFIIFCFLIQNLCCYCYDSLTIHSYLINDTTFSKDDKSKLNQKEMIFSIVVSHYEFFIYYCLATKLRKRSWKKVKSQRTFMNDRSKMLWKADLL